MVSKAIAAVDVWLESAERLLNEMRHQGISLSRPEPRWPVAGSAELIDPFGGPDEEDPDLNPDPTADAPPFGDEPEEDDDDDDSAI
jgi:hypothetical protein